MVIELSGMQSYAWFQTKIARPEVQLLLYYIHFEIAQFNSLNTIVKDFSHWRSRQCDLWINRIAVSQSDCKDNESFENGVNNLFDRLDSISFQSTNTDSIKRREHLSRVVFFISLMKNAGKDNILRVITSEVANIQEDWANESSGGDKNYTLCESQM